MSAPVFYTDRALGGKVFPDALEAAGIRVERHHDHFAQDASDEVWIAGAAARGWFALSNDKRILRNPVERDAVSRARLGYFVLRGANAKAADLAASFVAVYPAVERYITRTPRPFIASVRRPSQPGRAGRVVTLRPRS